MPTSRRAQTRFSGQLRLRLPRSLHKRIAEMAAHDGVSQNTMLVALIALGAGLRAPAPARGRR